MIKLTRPTKVPNKLLIEGKNKTLEHCNDINILSGIVTKGVKVFDSKIYGHKTVKSALKKAQNDKCCFCESKVTHISYGDVEHFRPKAAYKNKKSDKVTKKPAYYWLAYEWTNLLFSCQICNQIYKKEFFPLLNPSSRAKSPNDNITKEKPVFINPYEEDPKRHIGFRQEIPYGKTKRGTETIDYLGLDRDELNEERLKAYKFLEVIFILANALPDPTKGITLSNIEAAQNLLKDLTSSNGQYLSMVNTAIKNNFQIV